MLTFHAKMKDEGLQVPKNASHFNTNTYTFIRQLLLTKYKMKQCKVY